MGEAYSFPSDIWSFGIVLLECAIGKYPYPDMNAYLELMSAVGMIHRHLMTYLHVLDTNELIAVM